MRFLLIMTIAWFILAWFFIVMAHLFMVNLEPGFPIIPIFEAFAGLICAGRSGFYFADLLTLIDSEYC